MFSQFHSSLSLIKHHTFIFCLPSNTRGALHVGGSQSLILGVNLPMYTTLRRTTAAFTMGAEYLLAGHKHPREICWSVIVMVIGAGIAGVGDFHFDAVVGHQSHRTREAHSTQ